MSDFGPSPLNALPHELVAKASLLPSPLAGEGPGERGKSAAPRKATPSPQPLSREGRGA